MENIKPPTYLKIALLLGALMIGSYFGLEPPVNDCTENFKRIEEQKKETVILKERMENLKNRIDSLNSIERETIIITKTQKKYETRYVEIPTDVDVSVLLDSLYSAI